MHEKIIKGQVLKQLKKELPNWRILTKRQKKGVAKRVLAEVVAMYEADQAPRLSLNELTNTPTPMPGIITLKEMDHYIEETTRSLLSFPGNRWRRHFDDPELRQIDGLLDDRVLNRLLAPEGFTASMRELFPVHCFRAELLKALRYREFSYRKFCREVISRLANKRERAFCICPYTGTGT
jgi:hypothetical protein